MYNLKIRVLLWQLALVMTTPLCAQIQVPDLFTDHMVLQRGKPIPVWGNAAPGTRLTISINEQRTQAITDNAGHWAGTLPAMPAGGPYQLSIQSAQDTLLFHDLYLGEVWICSGQSNMEWPLRQSAQGETAIAQANHPLIRLFHLQKKHDTYQSPYTPEELEAFSRGDFFYQPQWEVCTPQTASRFSGVGYFFAKALQDSLQVPIGIIQAAVGGSPAQSWVSKEALASHPQLQHLVATPDAWLESDIIHPWLAERAQQNWVDWEKTARAPLPGHPFAPHYLFDAAIRPLAPFGIQGVIWYQGESNATHPGSYPALFEMLLKSWRAIFEQGDFPFYLVQLPKIGNRSRWPEFREAQQAGLVHHNTGMIVTLDQGHPTDVHPREKAVIGQRLARLALAHTYGKQLPAQSPMLADYTWYRAERKISCRFDHTYEGLSSKDQHLPKGISLQGYTEQGSLESIIQPANISIEKDQIIITYPASFLPTQVKYAWAPYPEHNLVNSAGLPLAPFKIELTGSN